MITSRSTNALPPGGDARFKAMSDATSLLVWTTDANGNFTFFNQAWLSFTGRNLDAELGRGWLDDLSPEDRSYAIQHFEENLSVRAPFRLNFRLKRHDGVYRWMLARGTPYEDPASGFAGYIGSCLDVSEEREAETRLAYRAITQTALASFGRFALARHPSQELMKEATRLICDTLRMQHSQVLVILPGASELTIAAECGQDGDHAIRPALALPVLHYVSEQPLILEEGDRTFPGVEMHAGLGVISAIAAPINVGKQTFGYLTGLTGEAIEFGRETTDFIQAVANILSTVHQRERAESALKESEHKLLQSQKLEAVGLLAGGVAHDFNNLLTAVRCYGDMLYDDLAERAPDLQPKVGEILKASARASALTRQLLAFSRKQIIQPEILDLSHVVSDLKDLVRSLLSENTTLQVEGADEPVYFEADRNQIDQVVLNLCINARDAMPQGGVLTLCIGTRLITSAGPGDLHPGRYAELIVTDDGVGMPPEVQARLFQPFFTTKPVGRGTGLGLATCAIIVKNSRGSITFESALGQGTTFRILFPQIDPPSHRPHIDDESLPVSGYEHILVVEDDDAIRRVTQNILESLGYKVTTMPGSIEALNLFNHDQTPDFNLLLTDIVMPDMDGRELAEKLCTRQPGLRIMFMSGYVGDADILKAVQDFNLPFLEKPFTRNALARKVRETLDNPPGSGLFWPPPGNW